MQPPGGLFDAALARTLVGKYVLIGVTYLDGDGKPTREEQVHGVVIAATAENGILFKLRGSRNGAEYRLPPDTRGFVRAQPGEYRLKSTGEVVTDPDFTCTWSVWPPRSA
jgi:hypothetical protein